MNPVVLAADLPTTPHAENSLQPWVGAGHRNWVSHIPGGLPGPQPKASEHPPGLPVELLPRVPTLGIPTSQNATGQGMGGGARAWASGQLVVTHHITVPTQVRPLLLAG